MKLKIVPEIFAIDGTYPEDEILIGAPCILCKYISKKETKVYKKYKCISDESRVQTLYTRDVTTWVFSNSDTFGCSEFKYNRKKIKKLL